jgi:DNA modification methylase
MILHAWNKESYYTPGHRQDLLKYKNVPSQKRTHPAEKPLPLLIHLINSTCKPNSTILDPFSGSGAVAVAARETQHEYITFDANPAFVKLTQRRLQTSLEEWQG